MTRVCPECHGVAVKDRGIRFVWTSEAGPPETGPARPDEGGLAPKGPRMLEQKSGPLDGHERSGTLARVSFHNSSSARR